MPRRLLSLALLALAACSGDERPKKALVANEPTRPAAPAAAVPAAPAPATENSAALTGKTTDARPQSLVGTIRGRAARTERLNEMRQIGLFYQTMMPPPATAAQFMDAIKRDSPPIHAALKEGYYVINPRALKRQVPADGIIAYEVEPDTNGQYVVKGDGSVAAIAPNELKILLAK